MTLDELANLFSARARLLQDKAIVERLELVGCNRVSASVKRRVFRDGIAQDGSLIGNYSTKPGWFPTSVRGLPKISPKGKPPSNRAKKTYYSETGYSGWRGAEGRQNSKVDLNLTGATFNGTGVGVNSKGKPAFGIKTREAKDRIEGNETRFDCITVTPNEAERKEGRDDILAEMQFILKIG